MRYPHTIQDLFGVTREQWLEGARLTAQRLLRTKSKITIEDVLERYPRPKYLHRNTTGSVFKTDTFVPVGYAQAKNPVSHKRIIRLWALSDTYIDRSEADCE